MPYIVVIAGVSGVGKTTVGTHLAKLLNIPFYDADDFHSATNVDKMRSGEPLSDIDRLEWLDTLASQVAWWGSSTCMNNTAQLFSTINGTNVAMHANQFIGLPGTGAILACSALKETFRKRIASKLLCDQLSSLSSCAGSVYKLYPIHWVFLRADFTIVETRITARRQDKSQQGAHFFPPELLQSQFDALELPGESHCDDHREDASCSNVSSNEGNHGKPLNRYGLHLDATLPVMQLVEAVADTITGAAKTHIGVYGMGIMGTSLARNLARQRVPVAAPFPSPANSISPSAASNNVYARYGASISLSLFNRWVPGQEEGIARAQTLRYPELAFARTFEDRSATEQSNEQLPFDGASSSSSSSSSSARIASFVQSLQPPRKILIMVNAGAAVDAVLNQLVPHLEAGDVVMDCGNSHYSDTERRCRQLFETKKVHLLGVGVSGGELGALNGPSIMCGGKTEAFNVVKPYLIAIAAVSASPPFPSSSALSPTKFTPVEQRCCALVGPDGFGHFVKMVHNGIEYAEMQFIAEIYQLLRVHAGYCAERIASLFDKWNQDSQHSSYLLEITVKILRYRDDHSPAAVGNSGHEGCKGSGSGKGVAAAAADASTSPSLSANHTMYEGQQPGAVLLLDRIVDQASQKGTGWWSTAAAMELGQPFSVVAEAVMARQLSAARTERLQAHALYTQPAAAQPASAQPPPEGTAETTAAAAETAMAAQSNRTELMGAEAEAEAETEAALLDHLVADPIIIDESKLLQAYFSARLVNHALGFDLVGKKAAELVTLGAKDLSIHPAPVNCLSQQVEPAGSTQNQREFDFNLKELARIWTSGCIIRSGLMQHWATAPDILPESISQSSSSTNGSEQRSASILLSPGVVRQLRGLLPSFRSVVALAAQCGCAAPSLSAALNHLLGCTTPRCPAHLIQAQRDLFGAHRYQLLPVVVPHGPVTSAAGVAGVVDSGSRHDSEWHHTDWLKPCLT